MLGKLAALLIILVAAAAFFALNYIDPEPSRACPTCGTTTLDVIKTSAGGTTLMRCTSCGGEVTIHG